MRFVSGAFCLVYCLNINCYWTEQKETTRKTRKSFRGQRKFGNERTNARRGNWFWYIYIYLEEYIILISCEIFISCESKGSHYCLPILCVNYVDIQMCAIFVRKHFYDFVIFEFWPNNLKLISNHRFYW